MIYFPTSKEVEKILAGLREPVWVIQEKPPQGGLKS